MDKVPNIEELETEIDRWLKVGGKAVPSLEQLEATQRLFVLLARDASNCAAKLYTLIRQRRGEAK